MARRILGIVAKLLAEGLIEEIQSRGSLPVWRRDGDNAHTLRIIKRGFQAIRVDDEATEAAADELPKKPPARSAKSRQSTQDFASGDVAADVARSKRWYAENRERINETQRKRYRPGRKSKQAAE